MDNFSGGGGGSGGSGGQEGGAGGQGGQVNINITNPPHTVDDLLARLPGWDLDGVKFNESKACLLGTRNQLLHEIHTWADSPGGKRVFWLSGGAGTGKTSVAHSIAASFDKVDRLGACFFFNRDIAGLNNPAYLFGNICSQIAHFDYHGQFGIRDKIISAIQSMGRITASSLQSQARKLIVNPARGAESEGHIIVVIDALDESGTTQTREELLNAIAEEFPKLPQSVKVMVTSRDEADIRYFLHDCSTKVSIDEVENIGEDIASYIRHRLMAIRRRSRLSERWPPTEKLQALHSRAGHSFIWASAACNFIAEKSNPARRLDILLNTTSSGEVTPQSPLEKLDTLYHSILRNALPDDDERIVDFHYIVGSIVVLEVPLTRTGLDSLLGLGDESGDAPVMQNGREILMSSYEIVSLLGSILRTDTTDSKREEGLLRLLHPSLYEFLTSRVEGPFRIDPHEQHHILAIRCLTVMNSQLRFDICQIGDVSLLNDEIKDLQERIKFNISDGLRYSCLSVWYHLMKVSGPDKTLEELLERFVSEHLLHWIEMMSLLKEISKAESSLQALSNWMKDHSNDNVHIWALIWDAIPFLTNFGRAIQLSALHTYYSALPLTPRKSKLFQHFIKSVPHVANIICSHPTWPSVSVRVLEGHTDIVSHVMFFPDGKKLASASSDHTVQLWDVESGQAIGAPIWDCTADVYDTTFSPDGKMFASASWDNTVRIWDVEDGQVTGEPFKVYTNMVKELMFSPDGKKLAAVLLDDTVWIWDMRSDKGIRAALADDIRAVKHLVFSPDGKMLATTSSDKTVQFWDVKSGQAIGGALKGHTNWVNNIVFSPDGKMLVTASYDNTVLLWDVKRCRAIRGPLRGHTDVICHVVFSPNGRTLASASRDKTVWLWDIKSGKAIGNPLQGHSDWVNNAVFSPDGKKLASASHDNTIQLWDVKRGKPIGEALNGHTDVICHVMFSPDGKILASASCDKTVRLWDVESCPAMEEPLQCHTRQVGHVVFSPNGKKLASTSYEDTVWLWDITHGQAIAKPLHHTDYVINVTFSPDGKTLVSVCDYGEVWFWDVRTCQVIGEPLKNDSHWIYHVMFSPDGQMLASTSYKREMQVWDVKTHETIKDAFALPIDYFPEDEPSDTMETTMSFDKLGFLRCSKKRLLWLPATLRGDQIAAQSSLIVVGGGTGAMTFIRLPA